METTAVIFTFVATVTGFVAGYILGWRKDAKLVETLQAANDELRADIGRERADANEALARHREEVRSLVAETLQRDNAHAEAIERERAAHRRTITEFATAAAVNATVPPPTKLTIQNSGTENRAVPIPPVADDIVALLARENGEFDRDKPPARTPFDQELECYDTRSRRSLLK